MTAYTLKQEVIHNKLYILSIIILTAFTALFILIK